MTRLATRTALLLVAGALLLGAFAAGARADEETSALERLTPKERRYLETHVPGWEDLAESRRERIAANVLRLRDLSPEERDRLRRRVEALEEQRRRQPGAGDRLRRLRLAQALLLQVWEDLTPEARAALEEAAGPEGRGHLAMVLFHRLWGAALARRAAQGVPEIVLPPDADPRHREHLTALRERAEQGDEGARRRLADLALTHEMRDLIHALRDIRGQDEARLRAVGARLKERLGDLWVQALAELERVAADPEARARLLERGGPERGPDRHRAGALLRLRRALREAEPILQRHPEAREAARRLQDAIERLLGPGGARLGPGPGPGPGPGGRRPR